MSFGDLVRILVSGLNSLKTFVKVHLKTTFDNLRMEKLGNLLDGMAKRFKETIGNSAHFYATALRRLNSFMTEAVII